MVPVVFVEMPQWLQQDGPRLFFFACVIIALFVLAKWASGKGESSAPGPYPEQDVTPSEPGLTGDEQEEEEEPDGPPTARVVSFTLRWMRFKSFELVDGPEDFDCFCDEVEIEINYKDGIMPWRDTWVATPSGLQAKLATDKKWSSFFAEQVLIVSRYDPVEIQTALLRQIKAELEAVPEELSADEMRDPQAQDAN